MPIYQVAERSFAAIKTIGHLRKGDPRPEGQKRPGADLDRFRFTSDDPGVLAAFKAAYGNGTEYAGELHVYLPYASLARNWDYYFEAWGGKKLKYRCNGREQIKWLLPDGKGYSREPRPCPICSRRETPAQGEHKPTGRLSLILPELLKAGYPGTVLLTTTAWSDVYSINAGLLAVEEQRGDGRGDDYRGIEFILRRELRDVPSREFGVQKKHVVVLQTVAEWIQAQIVQARADTLALMQTVDPATGEILDDEPVPDPEPDEESDLDLEDEPAPDWRQDPAKRQAIKDKCAELGITKADVVPALGVAKLTDFDGSYAALIEKLTDYAMQKKLAQAGPAPQETPQATAA